MQGAVGKEGKMEKMAGSITTPPSEMRESRDDCLCFLRERRKEEAVAANNFTGELEGSKSQKQVAVDEGGDENRRVG